MDGPKDWLLVGAVDAEDNCERGKPKKLRVDIPYSEELKLSLVLIDR